MQHPPMTRREIIALEMMKVIMTGDGVQYFQLAKEHAEMAVKNADALIAALDAPQYAAPPKDKTTCL